MIESEKLRIFDLARSKAPYAYIDILDPSNTDEQLNEIRKVLSSEPKIKDKISQIFFKDLKSVGKICLESELEINFSEVDRSKEHLILFDGEEIINSSLIYSLVHSIIYSGISYEEEIANAAREAVTLIIQNFVQGISLYDLKIEGYYGKVYSKFINSKLEEEGIEKPSIVDIKEKKQKVKKE